MIEGHIGGKMVKRGTGPAAGRRGSRGASAVRTVSVHLYAEGQPARVVRVEVPAEPVGYTFTDASDAWVITGADPTGTTCTARRLADVGRVPLARSASVRG